MKRSAVTSAPLYLLLTASAVFLLFPFVWMLLTALKVEGKGLLAFHFLPSPGEDLYTLENLQAVAFNEDFPFLRYLGNSLLVATTASAATVFFCALAAYVFAKRNFPGREVLFWSFMGAMMIPGMMYMVPQFALVARFGWVNTLAGLVVPHLANVFGVFLLRQYMQTIPDSLVEAAEIDGASEWQIFARVIVPLSTPVLITLFLLTFVTQWNNFLWQLIVNTPDSPYITVPVGLALFRGQYTTDLEKIMAGSTFSILPLFALFLFAQRYLIEGLTAGAVKE